MITIYNEIGDLVRRMKEEADKEHNTDMIKVAYVLSALNVAILLKNHGSAFVLDRLYTSCSTLINKYEKSFQKVLRESEL